MEKLILFACIAIFLLVLYALAKCATENEREVEIDTIKRYEREMEEW